VTNQYGRPGRAATNWGPDTIEGDLSEEELVANRMDQNTDNARHHFRDEDYYASKEYSMEDIKVPVLSVGNWGGILLHLRGNVHGFLNAGSKLKFLRLITGRHDLPFYTDENVKMQKSFLDAFLKDEDTAGWTTDKAPRVVMALRKGDVGHNDAEAEKRYQSREESDWPIPRTEYTRYYLTASKSLTDAVQASSETAVLSYKALGTIQNPELLQFVTDPFTQETEFTGHIVVHLNVSVSPLPGSPISPSDIDLFVTLRHLDSQGHEIHYTGTVGDPVPVTKGWLRVSLRKTYDSHPYNRPWHPHREYHSTDVLPVEVGQIYAVDVEVWPTNVIVSPGGRLVLEVSSGDTQGAGLFEHTSDTDRPLEVFQGLNQIHFGSGYDNWVLMPFIPALI
jgi:predicted acyl esterase